MYQFIDVTEVPGKALPAEALKLAGKYIEDQVEGYRTLYVSGREMLAPELEVYEVGSRDGSILQSRRFPARTITVGYQLIASTSEAFRVAYNRLNHILNVVDGELIFADEPDKYFIGTPSGTEDVAPGRCAITSEIEILCLDPLKYSVEEYEVTPSLDNGSTFGIDYKGTYRSYPRLEATFPSETEDASGGLPGDADCGYIVYMHENESVIQLGDPEEADTESYPMSQTLANQVFSVYDSVVSGNWPANVGTTSGATSVVQTGTLKIATDETSAKTKMLSASSYGSGDLWHGPSVTKQIPPDLSGHTGAKNFRLTYKQRMCMGNGKDASKECGVFQAMCVSKVGANKTIVAGVSVFKKKTGNKATLRFYVNGKGVEDMTIDLARVSWRFGYTGYRVTSGTTTSGLAQLIKPVLTSSIQKSGGTITFNIANIKKSFYVSAIKDVEVHEVTFVFGKYGNITPLTTNGLYWAKFISDACDTFQDIPNKFGAEDVVEADCQSGEVYLNNASAPEYGALGNDWETFCLEPGMNQIHAAWSDWVPENKKPTFKLRYREVYL